MIYQPQVEHEVFEQDPQLFEELEDETEPELPDDLNEKLESRRSTLFELQSGHLKAAFSISLVLTSSSKLAPHALQQNS